VSIDHIVSIIVFIAAILLFVGLFTQTVQTAIVYQQHQAVAVKCSDLLDDMLLNPGSPNNWGQNNATATSFGVQDPEFTQYELSAFSLMRLESTTGQTVEFDKTNPSIFYNEETTGAGSYLLMPNAEALNYSSALSLLGLNGTYGFQLAFVPDITVSIAQTSTSPLSFSVSAMGTGFPYAGATLNYCLILVTLGQTNAQYPSYTIQTGSTVTSQQGTANIVTSNSVNANQICSLIVYAHSDGIVGVGFETSNLPTDQYIVPIMEDMGTQQVALAHNYDLNNSGPAGYSLKYNATFVILTQGYTLSELALGSPSSPGLVGTVTSGVGNPYPTISMPGSTTGILIVTYQENSTDGGIAMMPWGISSLAFPVTFGGNPALQEWVTTDLRQVTIGSVAYQAKLSFWSDQQMQVTS